MDSVKGEKASITLKDNHFPRVHILIFFDAEAEMHPEQLPWFYLYQVYHFGNAVGIFNGRIVAFHVTLKMAL